MALGVAEALDYLHGGNSQPVIHRDVKSSNILLSDDFEPQVNSFLRFSFSCSPYEFPLNLLYINLFSAWICLFIYLFFQLSDFGLAKWASTTTSHITCTDVSGTFGYVV